MKKQKGFALVPILLILVLITAVGFTGYYVYDKQNSKKTDSSASVVGAAKTTPSSSVAPTTTPSTMPNPDTKKFLIIKEWGVKLYAEDPTTVLEYKINENGIAEIRSNKLNAVSSNGCTDNSIHVTRGKVPDHVIGETGYSEGTFKNEYDGASSPVRKHIGDYYYLTPGYRGASCAGIDSAKMKTEEGELDQIINNINTHLVAIWWISKKVLVQQLFYWQL